MISEDPIASQVIKIIDSSGIPQFDASIEDAVKSKGMVVFSPVQFKYFYLEWVEK